jgi:chromosome segregation ATPase
MEFYRVEWDSLDEGHRSADGRTLDALRTTASEELSRMIAISLEETVRDYTHELGDLREELGADRAHREMADTKLREGLAEERRRREEAERERDDLRPELHALKEPRESPVPALEAPEGGEESPGPVLKVLKAKPRAHMGLRDGPGGVGCS